MHLQLSWNHSEDAVPKPNSPAADHLAFRKLVFRGRFLCVRLAMLHGLLVMVKPVATPVTVWTIRRWFDKLHTETKTLSAEARSLRSKVAVRRQALNNGDFQNPWV